MREILGKGERKRGRREEEIKERGEGESESKCAIDNMLKEVIFLIKIIGKIIENGKIVFG